MLNTLIQSYLYPASLSAHDSTAQIEPEPDNLEPSYETTHSWNSEPQNIEQEISNDEVWNRFARSF
jgi:hypothetical protein